MPSLNTRSNCSGGSELGEEIDSCYVVVDFSMLNDPLLKQFIIYATRQANMKLWFISGQIHAANFFSAGSSNIGAKKKPRKNVALSSNREASNRVEKCHSENPNEWIIGYHW